MATSLLQTARRRLGYRANQVIGDLTRLGRIRNVPVMSETSLKVKLSRWENAHEQVSEPYRPLFRELYGLTNEELGFPPDEEDESAEQFRRMLTIARSVDTTTIDTFRQQLEQARRMDRKFGGVTTLDQLRGQINQVQELLSFSTMNGQREALAGVLTEASALAGWEALDRNAHTQAWQHHETAKNAAREANAPHLFAHAIAQQAFILIELGEITMAVEQLAAARGSAKGVGTPLLRAWLSAAYGEGLAAAGRRDDALRAFDDAATLLPTEPASPALPFLFLAGSHLDRWRGNVLSQLGEPDAIQHLAETLPRLPADFTRAKASMLVDLAFAHAATGDRDTALDYSRQARRLAAQIKSDRQLRRLNRLILPT